MEERSNTLHLGSCKRRDLWWVLLREFRVAQRAVQGRASFRLADLGALPDERLLQIKPIRNPEYELDVRDDALWCCYTPTGAQQRLFDLTPENLAVFNCFDGRRTLGEVGALAASELGWEEAQGVAHARALFLALLDRLVFVPRDPLQEG